MMNQNKGSGMHVKTNVKGSPCCVNSVTVCMFAEFSELELTLEGIKLLKLGHQKY